jgi:glucose/arabinose dehydrogenase
MWRSIWAVILLGMVMSGCGTAGSEPTATPSATETPSTPSARLIQPADGARYNDPGNVVLSWEWMRPLSEDEYFDVRVWQGDAPHYGIIWTKDSELELTTWLQGQQPGEYFWSVAVIEGTEGEMQAELAGEAPERRFTIASVALPTPTTEPTATPFPLADIVDIPDGFEISVYAQLPQARTAITAITFEPDGEALRVLTLDGRIFEVRDADNDDVGETVTQVLFNTNEDGLPLEYTVGLAFHEGQTFVSDKGRIVILEDTDDDGVYDQFEPIIEDLPALEYPYHSNNGIAFGPDGKLYVPVGSTTDHGPLQHPYESSILRMNPDGSAVEVFATGFRNPYDLAFSPEGELFTADNSPDAIDDLLTFYPPEELNLVREGLDYGFPDAYGFNVRLRTFDGREVEPPVAEFMSSTVSAGVLYYAEGAFPQAYHDSVFVVQYGGFLGRGYKVVYVPLDAQPDGRYLGTVQTFVSFQQGWQPIDITLDEEGNLYIAEWSRGTIYVVRPQ